MPRTRELRVGQTLLVLQMPPAPPTAGPVLVGSSTGVSPAAHTCSHYHHCYLETATGSAHKFTK